MSRLRKNTLYTLNTFLPSQEHFVKRVYLKMNLTVKLRLRRAYKENSFGKRLPNIFFFFLGPC